MGQDPASPSTSGGAGRVEVDLALDDPAWLDDLPEARETAESAARAALEAAVPGVSLALALVLADDDRLARLNRDWRGKEGPTNVLAFPSETRRPGAAVEPSAGAPAGGPVELGDVVLARQTLLREAAEQGLKAEHHLAHLVVHGTLHLLGFDHGTDEEADAMEAMERVALARLGVADPYARGGDDG